MAGVAAVALGWWLLQPLPLPVSPFVFDVKAGASLKSVARDLVAAGVLPHELPLVALGRIAKVDRSIKAGNYEIAAGVTLPRLLDKLTAGDVTQSALTVVEGGTFAELAAAIDANPAIVKTVLGAAGGRARATHRRVGDESRGLVLPGHVFHHGGLVRSRAPRPRPPPDAPASRRGLGTARR